MLVLRPSRQPLETIAANRFAVSIDSGRCFELPMAAGRGQPDSLSILLDVKGQTGSCCRRSMMRLQGWRRFRSPSGPCLDLCHGLFPDSYFARWPADPVRLKSAVDAALQPWVSRGRREDKHGCSSRVNLWDALTFLTDELYDLPGRRVILAVTDGVDRGSKYTWNQLRSSAQLRAVAIFGLRYVPAVEQFMSFERSPRRRFQCGVRTERRIGDSANESSLEKKLKLFTAMLRGRYIVEFPRPLKGTPGPHGLAVKIDKSHAFIRSAGISVPMPDPAVMADPTTVPSDPSRTPELGKRRILTAP